MELICTVIYWLYFAQVITVRDTKALNCSLDASLVGLYNAINFGQDDEAFKVPGHRCAAVVGDSCALCQVQEVPVLEFVKATAGAMQRDDTGSVLLPRHGDIVPLDLTLHIDDVIVSCEVHWGF